MGIRVNIKQNDRHNYTCQKVKATAKLSLTRCAGGKGQFCRNEVLVVEYNVEQ